MAHMDIKQRWLEGKATFAEVVAEYASARRHCTEIRKRAEAAQNESDRLYQEHGALRDQVSALKELLLEAAEKEGM